MVAQYTQPLTAEKLAAQRRQPDRQTSAEKSDSESSSLRCLVVDDNLDAANLMKMLLGSEGFSVEIVDNGASAVDFVHRFNPAVVLLDIGLPDIDGYQVAEQLRAGGYGGLLIAVSGHGEADDIQRAEDVGFDHHLLKPTPPALLIGLIRDHVEKISDATQAQSS